MGPEMQAGASGPAQARLKVQTVQHFSVAEAPMYDTVCENRPQQQNLILPAHTFARQNERSEKRLPFYLANGYKNALAGIGLSNNNYLLREYSIQQ